MKFDKLSKLETIKNIKQLDTIKPKQKVNLLNECYLLNYTATILLHQMQILRNEIVINDRTILKVIENEALKVVRSLMCPSRFIRTLSRKYSDILKVEIF